MKLVVIRLAVDRFGLSVGQFSVRLFVHITRLNRDRTDY